MNSYDFTQPGGFPFDQGVMQFLQDCIDTASTAAALAGPLGILSGCIETGPSAAPGFVVINGETLPFEGGTIQAKVIIQETATAVAYQDGTPRTVKHVRIAKFGDDGITNYQWTNFKRNTVEGVLARIDRLEWLTAPDRVAGGSMRFWNKPAANIPTGWQEVSAFAGRFPMGRKAGVANFDLTNVTTGQGGAETHTLTIAEMPEHDHDADINVSPGGTGASREGSTTPGKTGKTGGGQAHSILNPYRIVLFIEPIPNFIS